MANDKDVRMLQTADIKVLMPMVKEIVENSPSDSRLAVTMVGPIYISSDKSLSVTQEEKTHGRTMRDVSCSTGLAISQTALTRFKSLLNSLPEPRLDSLVQLAFTVAHEECKTIAAVGRKLNCDVNQSRHYCHRFGLVSS